MATRKSRKVYNSPRWKHVRHLELEAANRTCRNCGKMGLKLQVHHPVPLSIGGAPYDLSNLRALCEQCHKEAHLNRKPAKTPAEQKWIKLVAEMRNKK